MHVQLAKQLVRLVLRLLLCTARIMEKATLLQQQYKTTARLFLPPFSLNCISIHQFSPFYLFDSQPHPTVREWLCVPACLWFPTSPEPGCQIQRETFSPTPRGMGDLFLFQEESSQRDGQRFTFSLKVSHGIQSLK